jgi:hypothetical protein
MSIHHICILSCRPWTYAKAEPYKSLVFSIYVIVSIFLSDFLCSHYLLGYLSQAHNIFTINLVWECLLEALLQQIGIKTFTSYSKKDIAYDQFFLSKRKIVIAYSLLK